MKITFELDNTSQRPIAIFENGVRALLDTGAQIPVWVMHPETLEAMGGVKVAEKVPFSGFGGTAYGKLYRLTDFHLGELVYPSLHIIASEMKKPAFHIILSATMFSGLIYEIDDHHHRLNVTIPEGQSLKRKMMIEDSNGKIHILTGNAE